MTYEVLPLDLPNKAEAQVLAGKVKTALGLKAGPTM